MTKCALERSCNAVLTKPIAATVEPHELNVTAPSLQRLGEHHARRGRNASVGGSTDPRSETPRAPSLPRG